MVNAIDIIQIQFGATAAWKSLRTRHGVINKLLKSYPQFRENFKSCQKIKLIKTFTNFK